MSFASMTLDPNVERGAENLAERCLCVRPGESVCVLTWQADEVYDVIARAIERAGGVVTRVPLEGLVRDGNATRVGTQAFTALASATASVLLSGKGIPTPASVAVVQAAKRAGVRHLHVTSIEARTLAQSIRAEPDVLATINARLATLLRPPSRVRATSETGTALDVVLSAQYPLMCMNGRPGPGEVDNLPSGFIFTFPAQISGTLVVDRAIVSSTVRASTNALRRTPVTVTIASGRVTAVQCADATLRAGIDEYLASHPEAARVGRVSWPTNYLVRSEIGLEIQDALLPGMQISLGYTASDVSRAPYDAPVQLRLLGRRLNVDVGGRRVVTAGRFEDALVEGIDPFR